MRTICEVIDFGGVTRGGFIHSMMALSRAVRDRGDRFVVVSSDIAGVTWYDELRESGADLRLVRSHRELTEQLNDIRPDIIHSHFTKYDVALARWAFRTPVFWHVHSHRQSFAFTDELRARIKYMVVGAPVRGWICVSSGVAQEVLERGAPKARVRVVPNGIDTSRFRPPTEDERARSRARLGIEKHDRVILFFDRSPAKGGDVLRAALARLRGYRLLLQNIGPEAEWRAFAEQNDVIVAPYLADPQPLFWAADAFAFASHGEAFGFVLFEAAACALPIASTSVPPAVDSLENCDGVYLSPPGDADALADGLARALAHGPSEAARRRIVESLSMERWIAEMLRAYDAV